MDLNTIAENIENEAKRICLIYAFNGTGKTLLSVKYKDLTKGANGGNHAGVYYNAFSEDLFQWENDPTNENIPIKLNVVYSPLNTSHSYIIEAQHKLQEYLDKYHVRYYYTLNYNESDYANSGIESISFFADEEKLTPIKISRGEERIFIWCFFLTLFEVSNLATEQNAHIFIDDPVSSLDEHNIHITAATIMDIIKDNFKQKKIIITTHHVGLFSILIDRLRRGEGQKLFANNLNVFILGKNAQGEPVLSNYGHDVFLLHLHLYKQIQDNINVAKTKGVLESYNFVLLRQLLENIASFLGESGQFGFALHRIGFDKLDERTALINLINEQSHKDVYYYQTNMMSIEQKEQFEKIMRQVEDKFKFHI